MKTIEISKYERYALTSHLVTLPSPNPEHGRRRLKAWDELGVAELADKLALAGTGLGSVEIKVSDWADKKTLEPVPLNDDVFDYVMAGLGVQIQGLWADALYRLRERLEKLKA